MPVSPDGARWEPGAPIELLQELLDRGGVLAIPTESSYGLGVDPRNRRGVETIFAIKERDAGKPLPVVAASLEQIRSLGVRSRAGELERIARCWPAPLSLILPLEQPLPASADGRSLAVRIPGHSGLRRLLESVGRPLTATSANLSGEPPILDPQQVGQLLAGRDAMVIDEGRMPGGPPSTLVRWSPEGLVVLRRGRFAVDRLQSLLGDVKVVSSRLVELETLTNEKS